MNNGKDFAIFNYKGKNKFMKLTNQIRFNSPDVVLTENGSPITSLLKKIKPPANSINKQNTFTPPPNING